MDATLAPGMDRLLREVDIPVGRKANGDVRLIKIGGGIHLQLFFQNILQSVHDNGEVTIEGARKAIERSHNNLFPRMRLLYQDAPEDGVDACIRAVLSQMVLRGFLVEDNGIWRKGPAFVLDAPMNVVQRPSGEWVTAMVPTEMSTELTLDGEIDQMRQDLKALALRLERHGPGLRPVTPEGVALIKKSLLEHGFMPGYPLLIDHQDRILGGRHRMRAEDDLKAEGLWAADWPPTWPTQKIEVVDDRQAIGIAMAGNYTRRWTADDFKRLEKAGLGSTKTQTQRRLLELLFIEDPGRSVENAAALIGCAWGTAHAVREVLLRNSQIEGFVTKPGRQPDAALRERVRALWLARPSATQQSVAAEAGCSRQQASKIRKELEGEGLLQPKKRSEGIKHKENSLDEAKVSEALNLFKQGMSITEVQERLGRTKKSNDREVLAAHKRLHPNIEQEIEDYCHAQLAAGLGVPSRSEVHTHLGFSEATINPEITRAWQRVREEQQSALTSQNAAVATNTGSAQTSTAQGGGEQSTLIPAHQDTPPMTMPISGDCGDAETAQDATSSGREEQESASRQDAPSKPGNAESMVAEPPTRRAAGSYDEHLAQNVLHQLLALPLSLQEWVWAERCRRIAVPNGAGAVPPSAPPLS